MGSFFAELKRRRVYRVAIVYAAVAFVIWQIAEIAVPGLDLPDWTLTFVILLTLLGFPIALVLAWAFEITPEGVKRTEPLAEGAARPGPGNRAIAATAAIVVLVLAVAVAWLVIRDGGPAPSTARKSIAVLPFDNLSNDPEADEYFAEGVHDEIIAYLSKIGDLKVTSRTSVMRYKDTGMSLRDIAAQLDVATILEGAVRRADDRVRIAVRLIDAHADEQLWAEIYERDYADIFAIQVDVAEQIAAALRVTLTPEAEQRIQQRPTESLAAMHRPTPGSRTPTICLRSTGCCRPTRRSHWRGQPRRGLWSSTPTWPKPTPVSRTFTPGTIGRGLKPRPGSSAR
jgi:TolB-like protein